SKVNLSVTLPVKVKQNTYIVNGNLNGGFLFSSSAPTFTFVSFSDDHSTKIPSLGGVYPSLRGVQCAFEAF
ncbi:unnamed protein product, partial [Tenebrio molitor]